MDEPDMVTMAPTTLFPSPAPAPPEMKSLDDIEESDKFSEQVYIPQVKYELVPKLKQEFGNLDEVKNFYNIYARESGFSVRMNSSKTSKDGETIRKEYVCYKEGKRRIEPTKRRRGLTREGCLAKLTVVKNRSGEGFVVSQFVEGHNHPLTTPKRVHLLKSHRRVSEAQKSLTQHLAAANVSPSQQMSIFELQSGGLENVGFILKDLYNAERDRKKMYEGHDANMLYEHFEVEQQKNPGFVFTMEKDNDGRMTHCFWADATSRKSYQYFGDVVVFDTTYNTNRYSLIFAPILGVNHHGQTTLFGCAFLSNETTDSFEWLFKEFLKAMPGRPPQIIITDQDAAMTKAIACVLPDTFHRYCIWHILSKFSEKIGALAYKQHGDDLRKCIWNSESPEEFEARWADIVGKSNLSSNEWLQTMYHIRERWVPAYSKHIFSAHMTSSQRAEISHSFFKRYVFKENSLFDFVARFKRALSKIRHNELDLDHKDKNERPILKTSWLMEKRASELYTRHAFYKFQHEIFQVGAYELEMRHEDEHGSVWNVKRVEGEGLRSREVSLNKSSNYVSCSCKMFEFDGIPCRHLLLCLVRMQFKELPANYILQRWTNAAKAGRVMDDLGSHLKEICDTSILVRRHGIFQLACNVVDDAILDEEGTEILREALQLAQKNIALMRSAKGCGSPSLIQAPISLGIQHNYKEPLHVRAKGCGKRLKGGKEKAMNKKIRRCNCCRLTGHDKRNCPKLHNMSLQDVRLDDDDDEADGDDGDGSSSKFQNMSMQDGSFDDDDDDGNKENCFSFWMGKP